MLTQSRSRDARSASPEIETRELLIFAGVGRDIVLEFAEARDVYGLLKIAKGRLKVNIAVRKRVGE